MDTDSPFPVDGDRWLKIKPKTLGWTIGLVAVAVGSWLAIKFDVSMIRRDVTEHSQALHVIKTQLQVIESDARTAREAVLRNQNAQDIINLKLDYLTGDKRGPRPATSNP